MRGLIGSFVADPSGATAIELALVAIPFFGVVFLIFELGLFHFGQQSLDFVTREAGRRIMTGKVPVTIKSADQFKQELICPEIFWKVDCTRVVVNAYRVAKASNAADKTGVYSFIDVTSKALQPPETDPKKSTFCTGAPGDYIFVDVAYQFPSIVGGLFSGTMASMFSMRSTTFVFNEPFTGANGSGPC